MLSTRYGECCQGMLFIGRCHKRRIKIVFGIKIRFDICNVNKIPLSKNTQGRKEP